MSRAPFSQFGNRRPGLIRTPNAIPNISESKNLGALGRTVFDAFGAARVGAQISTAETQRGQQEESAARSLEIAEDRAVEDAFKREEIKVKLKTDELREQFDDISDLEMFGVQELMTRGDEQTKREFLANHRWADPKNQKRIEGFYGRQLATTDWFRAQREVSEFYGDPANDGDSMSITELMGRFLDDRSDLPAGAGFAYQQQFQGQVGNLIFQQEVARSNRRSKDIKTQRNFDDSAAAGMFFTGHGEMTDFAQIVSDGIEMVEGSEDGAATSQLLIRRMSVASAQALDKMVGKVPNRELEAKIAELPDPVRESSEVKFIQSEMAITERRQQLTAQVKEADNIKVLSTRFKEANDIRGAVLLRSRIEELDEGASKQQASQVLESVISQMAETKGFQTDLIAGGANVSINDITNIEKDIGFETPNYQRAQRTLREMPRKKAFQAVAELKNRAIAEMLIRAEPQEINDLVRVLNDPDTRDTLAGIIEQRDSFTQKSDVFKALSKSMPGTVSLDRYGDRFTRHMLEVMNREIDPVEDPDKAAKIAGARVKEEMRTDFINLKIPGAQGSLARSDLFGVGSIGKISDKDGFQRLRSGLIALAFTGRQAGGQTVNTGLAFKAVGSRRLGERTYVPSTGNGIVGAFMEWDQRTQTARIITPGVQPKLFAKLEDQLLNNNSEADFVSNADVRWRPEFGARTVAEFDAGYYADSPSEGLGAWFSTEAQRRWFDQQGELPKLDLAPNGVLLEGREREEVMLDRSMFRTMMNLVSIEHGWLGLDPNRVPPGLTSPPPTLQGGANVDLIRSAEAAVKKAESDFAQTGTPVEVTQALP